MNKLTLDIVFRHVFEGKKLEIDQETHKNVEESFTFLDSFSRDKIIYGINTGFGPMAQFRIEPDELNQLQYNLIRSHSSGTGKALETPYARSVVLARLNNFLQGNSGISAGVVDQLQIFLNKGITPEIFEHGSVGASGDLVQLSHLALNLIGEGHVYIDGESEEHEFLLSARKVIWAPDIDGEIYINDNELYDENNPEQLAFGKIYTVKITELSGDKLLATVIK